MKNNLIIKTILTVAALLVLIGTIVLVNELTKTKSDGQVTIEYVGLDNTVIKSKTVNFYEGDTLVKLVQENFKKCCN